jgi:hypothetical protein
MISDRDFINAWKASGGAPAAVAAELNIAYRNVMKRRLALEMKLGIQLPTGTQVGERGRGDGGYQNDYMQRVTLDGFTGTAVIFSDCHYWPGSASVAHLALVEVAKELKPKLLIGNGDLFDGARLSRFPRNGWEAQPRVVDELDAAKERLAEVRHAAPRAQTIRTVGNHCIRFDRYLAMSAGELEGIAGARLADHLPAWHECMSVFINNGTMVKHRFNGGIHAAYNNTLKGGTNIVTGHTHHLEVKPWGDYRGRRYGVQTGAIADTSGPQFGYTEDNPTPWCSGFAVLTFDKDGRLLMPELCEVVDGTAYFRGQKVAAKRRIAA